MQLAPSKLDGNSSNHTFIAYLEIYIFLKFDIFPLTKQESYLFPAQYQLGE